MGHEPVYTWTHDDLESLGNFNDHFDQPPFRHYTNLSNCSINWYIMTIYPARSLRIPTTLQFDESRIPEGLSDHVHLAQARAFLANINLER